MPRTMISSGDMPDISASSRPSFGKRSRRIVALFFAPGGRRPPLPFARRAAASASPDSLGLVSGTVCDICHVTRMWTPARVPALSTISHRIYTIALWRGSATTPAKLRAVARLSPGPADPLPRAIYVVSQPVSVTPVAYAIRKSGSEAETQVVPGAWPLVALDQTQVAEVFKILSDQRRAEGRNREANGSNGRNKMLRGRRSAWSGELGSAVGVENGE
jgi:hypothetical protein